MQTLLIELKHALRGIAAQPWFSALVVGVLGVGLACVLYTLVIIDGVYWRPLPFADAGQLFQVGIAKPDAPRDALDGFSDADLIELQRRLDGKADLAGFYTGTITLSDLDRPQRYDGAFVSANLLRVLGATPLLGRAFAAGDDRAGAAATVMISYALWQNRYAGAIDVVGRQVRVNARPATIIGVMPQNFSFPIREAIWVPAALREDIPRGAQSDYDAVARLPAGVEPAAIQPLLDAWLADALHKEPDAFRDAHMAARPLSTYFTDGPTRAIFARHVRRRAHAPAARLRECRQPAADAHAGAAAGAGRARRTRRESRTPGAAPAGAKPAAVAARLPARLAAGQARRRRDAGKFRRHRRRPAAMDALRPRLAFRFGRSRRRLYHRARRGRASGAACRRRRRCRRAARQHAQCRRPRVRAPAAVPWSSARSPCRARC